MKKFVASEGKVFFDGENILGNIIYTPDDFDESILEQIDEPEEKEDE